METIQLATNTKISQMKFFHFVSISIHLIKVMGVLLEILAESFCQVSTNYTIENIRIATSLHPQQNTHSDPCIFDKNKVTSIDEQITFRC